MIERPRGPSVDELWLRAYQKMTAYIAHDLKGALNGVSVNLEVVRSRSERPGSSAADVQKFSVSACEQLGVVIRATTSLLSAGRAVKGPVEVTSIARTLVNVIVDTYANDRGSIESLNDGGLSAETSASANLVRLAVAESLLSAISTKQPVSVRVRSIPAPGVDVSPWAQTGCLRMYRGP